MPVKHQRHHIVQEKYLLQWSKDGREMETYLIPENKFQTKGPGWKVFWRDNYNIIDNDKEDFYLPEQVTAIVDREGLRVIKKLKENIYLTREDRSAIAFYVALQFIRTPRFREERDKFISKTITNLMRKDISSFDKVTLTKKELMDTIPENEVEKNALLKFSRMSEEEIKKITFETIQEDIHIQGITDSGHSKEILKVDKLAKEIYEFEFEFLMAQKGTSFITSDNPCFTVSDSKFMNGILSPKSTIFFPLRPDICICIRPKIKGVREKYLSLGKTAVKNINKVIYFNSYQCILAKDRVHLESVTKGFNHKEHKRSRDAVVYEDGDYTIFNIE